MVDGSESTDSAFAAFAGFAGFADAMVKPGLCELRRGGGFLPLVGSSVAVLSVGDDSVVVSEVVPVDGFDGSGVEAFGASAFGPGELSDVEASPEGDGSSAHAIPLPKPTATQADSMKAATVNRSHQ
jgi:hypothetical protein